MKQFDSLSSFFSVVPRKVYYIVTSLMIALLVDWATSYSLEININIRYLIAISVYYLTMTIIYIAFYLYKKKHNKLEIKHLKASDKLKMISIKILISVIFTLIVSIIQIEFTINKILNY